MTFRYGYHPDPAIAPLVSFGNRVLIAPTLVTMSAFERNLLRAAALNPDTYGPIGTLRGSQGPRDVERLLAAHDGVATSRAIKVVDGSGTVLGDLDVVAMDPRDKVAVAIEVKWPSPPDSLQEVSKAEDEIAKGQAQLATLKSLLLKGLAEARLPASWPQFSELSWSWLVVCRGHQTSTPALVQHEITPISRDRLWYAMGDSLAQTIRDLRQGRRLPKEGSDFKRVWRQKRLGDRDLQIEALELL
jgi:hypothetical protein